MLLHVDNSLLRDFVECERKAILRHGLGLTTDAAKIPLRAGQDTHDAVAVFLPTTPQSARSPCDPSPDELTSKSFAQRGLRINVNVIAAPRSSMSRG